MSEEGGINHLFSPLYVYTGGKTLMSDRVISSRVPQEPKNRAERRSLKSAKMFRRHHLLWCGYGRARAFLGKNHPLTVRLGRLMSDSEWEVSFRWGDVMPEHLELACMKDES